MRCARPGADRLHLPALEREPGLELLLDEIVVEGFSVFDDAHWTTFALPLSTTCAASGPARVPLQRASSSNPPCSAYGSRCSCPTAPTRDVRSGRRRRAAIRSSCRGAPAARDRSSRVPTARPRASTSTITACTTHFTTDNANRAAGVDRHHAEGRSVSAPARRMAFRALGPRRVQGGIRAHLRIHDARCSKRSSGPVFGHIANTFIDAFVRRAEARLSGAVMNALRSPWPMQRPASRTWSKSSCPPARRSPTPSRARGSIARHGLDANALRFAMFGQRTRRRRARCRRRSRRIHATARRRSQGGATRAARQRIAPPARTRKRRAPDVARLVRQIARLARIRGQCARCEFQVLDRPACAHCRIARRGVARRRCVAACARAGRARSASLARHGRDGRGHGLASARRTSRSTRSDLIGVDYQFGGETPETRSRLQRPRALRVPAGHRRHAAAHVEGNEPARRQGRRSAICSPAISCSSTRAASRSRTSASIWATTASSMRRRAGSEVEISRLSRELLAEALQRRAPAGRRAAVAHSRCRSARRGAGAYTVGARGRTAARWRPRTQARPSADVRAGSYASVLGAGAPQRARHRLLVAAQRPVERRAPFWLRWLTSAPLRDQQRPPCEPCLRAPPSSAPSCRWATAR